MNNNQTMNIAIQKNGRLTKFSQKFLKSLGLNFSKTLSKMVYKCTNQNINLLLVRDNDIPKLVSTKKVDFGIVGLDVLKESGLKVTIIKKLNFCKCALVLAKPKKSSIKKITDLQGKKIATSFPNILKEFLLQKNIKAKIVKVEGSVELAPYLQAADAVCDITQTGKTLKSFKLIPFATVLKSEAVLIKGPKNNINLLKSYDQS